MNTKNLRSKAAIVFWVLFVVGLVGLKVVGGPPEQVEL